MPIKGRGAGLTHWAWPCWWVWGHLAEQVHPGFVTKGKYLCPSSVTWASSGLAGLLLGWGTQHPHLSLQTANTTTPSKGTRHKGPVYKGAIL